MTNHHRLPPLKRRARVREDFADRHNDHDTEDLEESAHTPWTMLPPGVYIVVGVILAFFWLWGNMVQVQTSEAWIGQTILNATLAPHFEIFVQLTDFWTGKLSNAQMIADTWGWGVQITLLVVSMGIERPQLLMMRRYAGNTVAVKHWRGAAFWSIAIALMALNSIADLAFSGTIGLWGQIAFAIITLVMSFFFGLLAFQLITAGITGMRDDE